MLGLFTTPQDDWSLPCWAYSYNVSFALAFFLSLPFSVSRTPVQPVWSAYTDKHRGVRPWINSWMKVHNDTHTNISLAFLHVCNLISFYIAPLVKLFQVILVVLCMSIVHISICNLLDCVSVFFFLIIFFFVPILFSMYYEKEWKICSLKTYNESLKAVVKVVSKHWGKTYYCWMLYEILGHQIRNVLPYSS